MANNKIVFEFEIKGGQLVGGAAKQVDNVGKSLDNVKKKNKEAAAATGELNYKMNQGITGSSSAARSFSKLNQSIGHGPNGLVGAYATLAANIFAVSAAFNALRNAEQVDLLFKGLEAQGARTGKTLGLVADRVREISSGALSAADSMQAVALASSAGIDGKNIEALTTIARNASIALGRNLPDAMDRIFKGVVKLEPELLDELGLMTKLTEATKNYARENGKSAESLSGFEKRVAFMEAIKKEGEFKYEGIADTTGVNSFDKLAATFDNLVQKTLSWIGSSSLVQGILTVLTDTTYGLVGALLLFGNTLKTALLATFYAYAKTAAETATKLRDQAVEQRLLTKATLDGAQAKIVAARAALAEGQSISKLPKAYQANVAAMKEGSASAETYAASLRTLNRSQAGYKGTETKADKGKGNISEAALNNAKIQQGIIAQEIASINLLQTAQAEYTAVYKSLTLDRINTRLMEAKANAATSALAVTEEASKFKLVGAYTAARTAVVAYTRALILERIAALASAEAAGTQLLMSARLSKVFINLRIGTFALGLAFKALGTAVLSAIPILGTLMLAWSLIEPVIGWFKSDETKKKEKAYEDLNKVLDEQVNILNEYNRTVKANGNLGETTAKLLTIQSNAVRELSEAYNATVAPIDKSEKSLKFLGMGMEKTSAIAFNYLNTFLNTGAGMQSFLSESIGAVERSEQVGTEVGSKVEARFSGLADSFSAASLSFNTYSEEQVAVIKSLVSLIKLVPEAEDTFLKLDKSMGDPNKAFQATLNLYANGLKNITPAVSELTQAFKEQETTYQDFIKSLTPTTPYDKMVDSLTKTNNAIYEADRAFKKAKESGLDYSDKLSKLLIMIGPESRNILDINTQKALEEIDDLQSRINTLNDKKEITVNVRDKLKIESEINTLSSTRDKIAGSISSKIIETNQAFEDQQRLNQILTVQGQAQITLAQAKLAVLNKTTAVTAASLREQLEQENKIKKLQAEQVSLGIAELKQNILRKQDKIASLNADIQSYELAKLVVDQLNTQMYLSKLIRLEKESQAALTDRDITKQATLTAEIADTTAELAKISTIGYNKELQESIDGFKRNVESITKSITLEQAQITALTAQQQAILETMLSSREIELKGMKLTIGNNEAYNASLEETRQLKEEQQTVDTDINKLIFGRKGTIVDELNILKKQYAIKQRNLILDKAAKIAQLEVLKEEAKNEADKAKYSTDISIARINLSASLELEESKLRLASTEKVILDTSKEGLEYQQQALEAANKYFDLQSQLVTQRGELAKSNLDIIAAKYGTEINTQAQKRIELKVAQEEHALAQEQLSIKIEGIKLEYALLEAQRIQQILNWTMQRRLIALQLESSGQMTSTVSNMLAQLDTAIGNISARGYKDQEAIAIKVAQGEVELKRRKAAELGAGIHVKGSPVLNEIKAAFESISVIRQNRTPDDIPTIAIMRSIIPDLSEKLEEGMNNVNQGLQDSQSNLIKSNTDLMAVLNTLITTYKGTVNVNAQSTLSATTLRARPDILDAKKYVLAHGARNDGMEYGSKSKVHGGSGHREYRALDVNLAGGNLESRDPKLKAKANLMAKELAEKGFIVLWNHFRYMFDEKSQSVIASKMPSDWGPHEDHLHVETPKNGGARKIEQRTTSPVTTSAAAAPTVNTKSTLNLAKQTKSIAKEFLSMPPIITDIGAQAEEVMGGIEERTRKAMFPWADKNNKMAQFWEEADVAAAPFLANLAKLGPSGELVVAIYQGAKVMSSGITQFMDTIESGGNKWQAMADLASAAISTVSAITAASSQAKIASIDKEIAAEERRDGKSAASLQKLDAMNKKKDDIARKQFNLNKKLMMAQAVISTATGIAASLAWGPPGIPLAVLIGAMGAAQLAIIAGTSYESSYKPTQVSAPTSLSIGKVGNSVDLAKGPNANAGGEVGYLRGASGTGSNASNFRTVGSAYGGDLMRGYGNRGFTVGEKGPETISPDTPITVTPNNHSQPNNMNATINIQALDSAGVKDILVDQKGNIIKMLRDAANAQGQRFLEDVNVNVYTRPNVSKL